MANVKYENWNPWHGCTKISEGCRYCYVYRQDEHYGSILKSSEVHKNASFNMPIKRKRDGNYKYQSGTIFMTCFTSDFLLKDADKWREDCWKMIKERKDCYFYFFTKRIDRLKDVLPDDWNEGYDNVIIGCTIENQDRADYRLPIFKKLPIKHKTIIIGPMIEEIDIDKYLDETIEEVSCSGESGVNVRPLNYDWVLKIRDICIKKDISFSFHQTGAYFIKDGKTYHIPRYHQISQAKKANIDYKVENDMPINEDTLNLMS